jgi:hypothetical protein
LDEHRYLLTRSYRYGADLDARYNRPYSENGEMSYGLRTSHFQMSNDYKRYNDLEGTLIDTLRTYHFNGGSTNVNADVNWTHRWGGFTLSTGLGYELGHTHYDYTSDQLYPDGTPFADDSSFLTHSFRPSIHLTYRTESMHNLKLNYSMRMSHPGEENLTRFRIYGDDSYRTGNQKGLNPSYTHSMEAGWQKFFETFGNVGGTMVSMETGETQTHLEFNIPTRGIMGLKTRIMNVTHGEGVFYHTFLEYGPFAGDIGGRKNGAMISMSTEKAVAYALGTLQERGTLFVGPGDECYEGMLVGERPRPDDMVVNIAKTKQLGNQRSSTADIAVQLTPPRVFTLEEALEYIMDDELVEITPKNIRMRKRILNETDRRKWAVRHGLVKK